LTEEDGLAELGHIGDGEAASAGGDVSRLLCRVPGRSFDDDFLGLTRNRQTGDDAGGQAAAAKGVEALVNFGKVGDAVAVGVWFGSRGADDSFLEIRKSITV